MCQKRFERCSNDVKGVAVTVALRNAVCDAEPLQYLCTELVATQAVVRRSNSDHTGVLLAYQVSCEAISLVAIDKEYVSLTAASSNVNCQ